jgi:hypothetical protein
MSGDLCPATTDIAPILLTMRLSDYRFFAV